jgi:DNA-binding transcriptional regulator LsrR (DeoR family)
LGQAGARYLERILKGGERIGVSWGTTLRAVVDHLRPRPLSPSVVPLVGGLGQSEPVIHANDLAHRLAAVLGGDVHLLHAPAIVARRSVRRAMLSDGGIQRVLSMARQVQVALVGIGALVPTSTLVRSKYFGARDLSRLRRRGAIGDICTRPFSRTGMPVDDALQGRILAVEFSALKRIPTVVAVAGGVDKAEAIRGALEGHLVNVLVTDHLAARALLRAGAARVESAR